MKKYRLQQLMEAELDKAETILAVKELGDNIQGMAEDVAKMRVDKLMPLVETIKEQFGRDVGDQFQQQMDSVLEELQDNLTTAKNDVDNQVAVLNGDAPMDSDMTDELDDFDAEDSDMMGGDEDNLDDLFGADDVMAGGDEPLGRVKKESKQVILRRKIKMLEGKIKEKKRQKR